MAYLVPRRQPSGRVRRDLHTTEARGPVIQVLLVPIAVRLEAVIAPLDAAFSPPVERLVAVRVVSEGEPADVVRARVGIVGLRVSVRNEQNRAFPQFGEQRVRRAPEAQVGVEV